MGNKSTKLEDVKDFDLKQLYEWLNEIFEKRKTMEYGDTTGVIKVYENREEGTLAFEIGGRPNLYTGLGGFLQYMRFGGGFFELWYNGVLCEPEQAEKLVRYFQYLNSVTMRNEDVKLTKKEQWMLNWLEEKWIDDPMQWWRPTIIGAEYGKSIGKDRLHSSTASPTLIKLSKVGLIERSAEGWYRFKLND